MALEHVEGGPEPLTVDAKENWSIIGGLNRFHFIIALQIFDFLSVSFIALLISSLIRGGSTQISEHDLAGSALFAIFVQWVFYNASLYDLDRLTNRRQSRHVLAVHWTLIFVAMTALVLISEKPNIHMYFWLFLLYGGGLATFSWIRTLISLALRKWISCGQHTQIVAIIGLEDLTTHLVKHLERHSAGTKIIGVFDDHKKDGFAGIGAVSYGGDISNLIEYGRTHHIDKIFITIPLANAAKIAALITQLRQLPVAIDILPSTTFNNNIDQISANKLGFQSIHRITVDSRPFDEFSYIVKQLTDKIGALFAIIVLSPILMFCAIGIFITSRGPLFFYQKRVGYKGREFKIIKFRTMHHVYCVVNVPTKQNDMRVFPFGKLLRKFSLDELPQLFNVLLGDMSLVGPRPHMLDQTVEGTSFFDAVNTYAARHRVKPGITGWAQVNGWRGPVETLEQIEQRVEHDVYYINNWSLPLDICIIFRTLFGGFGGKNAF